MSDTAPSRIQRRLALPEDAIYTLTDAFHATFDNVRQHDLTHSTAWQAQRRR